jgi:pimeloyl-ACP methyl ester carboxylesterase
MADSGDDSISATTVSTERIEAANGVTYAYRRLGENALRPPLVMLQHYRGTLDNWDPLLVDLLAATGEVIIVDNTGIGASTGVTPRNVTAMARDVISFLEALELERIDLLGYSIGGMVAQELTLLRPPMVRRLVLAATGPQGGGEGMHGWITDVSKVAKSPNNTADDLLWLFFNATETSMQRGREFLARFASRKDRDAPNGPDVAAAQYDAIVEWGIPDPSKLARLAGIRQPTLVANGDNDTMIPPVNCHILARHIPNARVRIFPDAGHGFLSQWPREFAKLIDQFLNEGAHPD